MHLCIIDRMEIYIFGNPDIEADSMPFRLLPALKREFPDIRFLAKDPNEEWDLTGLATNSRPIPLIVLDTAIGIEKVTIFDGLESFSAAPRVSMHDFDALSNLRFMKKLGKIDKVTVIAVPPTSDPEDVLDGVKRAISEIKKAPSV